MRNNQQRNMLLGVAAAISVVVFWSGWIVVSRFGVTNSLTVYDMAGFRFSVGAAVALPYIIWRRTWQGLTPIRVLVLTLTAGMPYALLSYFGFTYAPAAHGGVTVIHGGGNRELPTGEMGGDTIIVNGGGGPTSCC